MRWTFCAVMTFVLLGLAAAGCDTAPSTTGKKIDLQDDARGAIARFKREDPSIKTYYDNAYGYAVFPNVGKGGFIAGGAYGRGTVYEQGQMVGYADLSQGSVGAQIGGQVYHEVIFFEYKEAMDHFKTGNWAVAANASAVIVTAGAAGSARYDRGVAIFVLPTAGAMAEAAIGGQKFSYEAR